MSATDSVVSTCPYCGQRIGSDQLEHIRRLEERRRRETEDTLRRELEVDVAERVATETAALSAKLKNEQERAEQATLAAESRIAAAELEAGNRVAAETAALSAKLKSERERAEQAELEAESRIAAAELDVANRVTAETAALSAKLKNEQERAAQAELNADSKIRAAIAEKEKEAQEEIQLAVQAKSAQVERAVKERDDQLLRAQKTIETLQKQLDEKPSYTRGGMQEDELVALLKSRFPGDRVQRVPGRSGADIEHEVLHERQSCGTIVYESKNVQNWNSDFIDKLIQDKVDCGASHAVLVTTAFPAKSRDFDVIKGVPLVRPELLVSLVEVLRQGLIEVQLQSASKENRGYKLEQLLTFINSPDFKNKMQNVLKAVADLEELQAKEKRAHERHWEEQTLLQRMIRNSSTDVQSEISGIVAGRS